MDVAVEDVVLPSHISKAVKGPVMKFASWLLGCLLIAFTAAGASNLALEKVFLT